MTGPTSRQLQRLQFADRERHAAGEIDQQQGRRGDARLVDRGDQRDVDQRRAEAREAAHEAGQRRDREGCGKAAVGQRGRKGRQVGKVDHGKPGGESGAQHTPDVPGWCGGCYQRGAMGQAIRILGIDPGLRRTGWGLIGCEGNRLIYVACGSVETNERLSARRAAGHDP